MLIVLDCPSCAKRYEVDAALAGKKSRCKQCGEVFRIPVPNAAVASSPTSTVEPRPERFSADVSDRPQSLAAAQPASQRAIGTPASPSFSPAAPSATKVVMNCPGCHKRYEVDGALAGKKSRCKDCGEVFQHRDRAVVLTFSGIPTNSDPAKGATTRDVSEAINARLRALVPNVTNFVWTRRNNRLALALSPINDIAGLAQRIDFGTATVRDNQIREWLTPAGQAFPERRRGRSSPRCRGLSPNAGEESRRRGRLSVGGRAL
jgi:predicted Zn finger-like uncharacterized protein